MRSDVAHGNNPADKRRADKKAQRERLQAVRLLGRQDALPGSFEHMARAWYEVRRHGWSQKHADKVMVRMEKHLFPALGHLHIAQIKRHEYTQLLTGIDAAGKTSTAGRLAQLCQRICNYADAFEHLERNPFPDVKEVLRTAITKHHAAITKPELLQEFVQSVDAYHGTFVVTCAIKLMMKTFLRSTEFRWARWSEIDFEKKVWMVPAERMKDTKENKLNGEPHMVPLSWQSIELLKQLYVITGRTSYVFAGQGWKKPVISESTINRAIQAMGYSTQDDQSTHGFRATARTILVEQLGWHKDIVELQLDHQVSDANGKAYNRVQLHAWRCEMMQAWSEYLDRLQSGVIPENARHHSQPAPQAFGIDTNFTVPFIGGKNHCVRHAYGGTNVMKITWALPSALPPIATKSVVSVAIPTQPNTRSST
jgi:integrase